MDSDYNNSCVSIPNFEKQITYINNHFKILNMDEFIRYSGEEAVATITFDDGYKYTMENVLPIISQYGVPITVFVTCVSQPEHEFWMSDIVRLILDGKYDDSNVYFELDNTALNLSVKDITDRCNIYNFFRRLFRECSIDFRNRALLSLHRQAGIGWLGRKEYLPLSNEDVLELSKNKMVTIGAHSINHISLAKHSEDDQRMEIEGSISILQRIIGRPINYFAYPFGTVEDYNDLSIRILKESGILAAFTTKEKIIDEMDYKYFLPRFNCVNSNEKRWIEQFEYKTFGKKVRSTEVIYCGIKDKDYRIENADKIVICGCGKNFLKTLAFLKYRHLESRIIAVVDSDVKKQSTVVEGFIIRKYEEFYNDNSIHWVIYNRFDYEIFALLVNNEVRNIHWWIDL